MPSLGILTVNALAAADSVIIPVKAEKPSMRGLQQLLRTIGKVRRSMNPDLQIEGILPAMVGRTNYNRDVLRALGEAYGSPLKIFDSIPLAVRVAETAVEGRSIYLRDRNSSAAKAYEKLTREVMGYGG